MVKVTAVSSLDRPLVMMGESSYADGGHYVTGVQSESSGSVLGVEGVGVDVSVVGGDEADGGSVGEDCSDGWY